LVPVSFAHIQIVTVIVKLFVTLGSGVGTGDFE